MELLAILIVLGLLQLWGSGKPLQKDRWFSRLSDVISDAISGTELRVLLSVGLPVIALWVVATIIDDWLFGLLSLGLYVVVLLYSLGRGDFSETLQNYLAKWNHGNFESAYFAAKKIGDFSHDDTVDTHEALHQQVRRAVFYQGYERWFAAVFWFLLLGPVGALLYRLCYLAGRSSAFAEDEQKFSLTLVHYLDYVPARILGFAFALTGNFTNGFNGWLDNLLDNQATSELLDHIGMAALSAEDELKQSPENEQQWIDQGRQELQAIQGLLSRSVVCWLMFIAVLEIFT
jgi:AmpE protein